MSITTTRPDTATLSAFFLRIDVKGDCWMWTGGKTYKGYGAFRDTSAHRWPFVWFVGPIPAGCYLTATCGRRACVNPAHREIVTPRESNDQHNPWIQRNACRRGHPLTDANTGWNRRNGKDRICLACRELRYARWYAKNGKAYTFKTAARWSDVTRANRARAEATA